MSRDLSVPAPYEDEQRSEDGNQPYEQGERDVDIDGFLVLAFADVHEQHKLDGCLKDRGDQQNGHFRSCRHIQQNDERDS